MKTLIIGGGMSGLTYGIISAKNGIETVICERNSRVGKKISATGNGKCNIANANVSKDCFNSSKIVDAVLAEVSFGEYLTFLQSCGIYTFSDSQGRVYPLSESAANVVDCLRFQFAKYGGKLKVDCQVTAVRKCGNVFEVEMDGNVQQFDKVVLACGSGSGAQKPELKGIVSPQWFTHLSPSLVPVKVFGAEKTLNGLRAKATATLLENGSAVATEKGEVQFKDYGLSGICIFNLSAHIARSVVLGKNCRHSIVLDLVPTFSQEELENILSQRLNDGQDKLFLGILHNKLAECVVKRSQQFTAEALAHSAKNLTFQVEKLLDYSLSQATAGGINEEFVDQTLTLPNGIVALGEVLNVDGVCGGNNLFFAGASAIFTFSKQQRNVAYGKK